MDSNIDTNELFNNNQKLLKLYLQQLQQLLELQRHFSKI